MKKLITKKATQLAEDMSKATLEMQKKNKVS